jgi:hypothetical protein
MAETTEEIRKLGKWLGVANRVGSALTYWILTDAAKIIARSMVQHVTAQECLNENIKQSLDIFQRKMDKRLDEANFVIDNAFESSNILQDDDLHDDPAYGDGSQTPSDVEYRMDMKPPDRLDEDDIQSDAYDKYIGAEISVNFGTEGRKRATVKEQARDFEGNFVGRNHKNPLLDTSKYIIEYDDGTSDRMFANSIAENIYSQVDDEGRHFVLLKDIVDHRALADAITIQEGFMTMPNGQKVPKQTTKGWELLVEWKDGSTSWIPLKDIKDTNPVEVAEYAIANKIDQEPAFAWWVKFVMRKRERIISKLQKKYWRTEYKFGVEQPAMKQFFSLCALLCMIVTYGDTDNAYQQSPPPTKQCYMAVNEAYVSWYLKRHGIDIDPSLYAIPVTGAIQGHPEAGQLWQDFIVSFLTGPTLKFTTTAHERNLYCGTFCNEQILVCRQVDDFAIGSTTTTTAEALIQVINSHAITSSNGIGVPTVFGISSWYNGLDVHQMRSYIKLSCDTYIQHLLSTHGWETPSSASTDHHDLVPLHPDVAA